MEGDDDVCIIVFGISKYESSLVVGVCCILAEAINSFIDQDKLDIVNHIPSDKFDV